MKTIKVLNYLKLIIIFIVSFLIFNNCASSDKKELVLATIDGETITEGDLIYSLTISHRREDLSSAGTLNLSTYINKLVEDKILVHDARMAGMDNFPEVVSAIDAFILRESVMKLREEEVLNKVIITDEEVKEAFKKDYELFKYKFIEVNSEDVAKKVIMDLRNGSNFEDSMKEYSIHPSKETDKENIQTRISMNNEIYNAIIKIKQGEYTEPVKISDKYYIVLFLGKEEAQESDFDNLKETIKTRLRKQKEKERGDECLEELKARAKIFINKEFLSEENLNKNDLDPELIVAQVDGEKLKLADFRDMIKQARRYSPEAIVNNWIERKLIDHEALSRNYRNIPEVKDRIKRYQDQLLKNTYIKTVILPQIKIDEEMLKNYYSEHSKDFMKPVRYKMQMLTVETEKEANEILENLKNGADFSWLAKKKSKDRLSQKSGELGWVTEKELPEKLRQNIGKLKPGDFSDVLKIDESEYAIYMLKEVSKKEIEDFDKVKDQIYKICFNEKLKENINQIVSKLKKDAKIFVHDENIKLLEDRLLKQGGK